MACGLYGDLTDEQLIALIREYRDAFKQVSLRGIAVIQGEGRRIEFTRSSSTDAKAEFRNMMTEARKRGLDIACGYGTGIAVEIG